MKSTGGGHRFMQLFFGFAACSWLPHWACHYYRLETGGPFIVGGWEFSPLDSIAAMLLYSGLAAFNLIAIISPKIRFPAALLSAAAHSALGAIHAVRLIHPFRFEVFGFPWSSASSMREMVMELSLGVLFIIVAFVSRRSSRHGVQVSTHDLEL